MKELIYEVANTVKNLFFSEKEKFTESLNTLENKISKQTVNNEGKPAKNKGKESEEVIEVPRKLYFSTCYRDKEQIDKSKIEHIISQLNLFSMDKNMSPLEIEKLRAQALSLDDSGIYLIIDDHAGIVAVPNRYYSSGIEFEEGITI
ncbi:MAG TPA: hypothetical protein DIV86_06365 [Alphaproteobacteria bacterium]|nr:hypothetical protein [Alphaproteobacteria bacterium]